MRMYFIIAVKILIIIILDVCLHKSRQRKSLENELQQGEYTNEAKIITQEISLIEKTFAP